LRQLFFLLTAFAPSGFREAEAVAKTELASAAFSNAANPEAFRQDLLNIARTTLSSKILTADKVRAQTAQDLRCCQLLYYTVGTSAQIRNLPDRTVKRTALCLKFHSSQCESSTALRTHLQPGY
jgi:hypothetical protein